MVKCNFKRPIFYRAVKIMYCGLWLIVDVYLIFFSIFFLYSLFLFCCVFRFDKPFGQSFTILFDCEKGTLNSRPKKNEKLNISPAACLFFLNCVQPKLLLFLPFFFSNSIVLFIANIWFAPCRYNCLYNNINILTFSKYKTSSYSYHINNGCDFFRSRTFCLNGFSE